MDKELCFNWILCSSLLSLSAGLMQPKLSKQLISLQEYEEKLD